jgi:hypothetical protein
MTICSPISRADARTGNSAVRRKDANEGDSPGGAEIPGPAVAGVGVCEGPRDDPGLGFAGGGGDEGDDVGSDVGVLLPHPPSTKTQTSTRARRLSIRCGPLTGLRRDGRGQARRIAAIVDAATSGVRCMGTLPTPGESFWDCATPERSRNATPVPNGRSVHRAVTAGLLPLGRTPDAVERSARAARNDVIAARGHQGPILGLLEVVGPLPPRRPTLAKGRLGVLRATRTPEMGTLSAASVHAWQFGHSRRKARPGAPAARDGPLGPSDGDRCTVAHRRRRSTVTA